MKVKLTKHDRKFLWRVVPVLLSSLVVLWLDFHGVFTGTFGPAKQLFLRLHSFVLHQAALPGIVTIAIDDRDYKEFFNNTSPLEPRSVMALVNAIRQNAPSVLGVDILTDGDYVSDKALELSDVPTVWVASLKAVTFTETGFFSSESDPIAIPDKVLGQNAAKDVWEPIKASRDEVPQNVRAHWAIPVFATDDDGVVRRFPRRWFNRIQKGDGGQADVEDRRIFAREVADTWLEINKATITQDDETSLLLPPAQSYIEVAPLTVGELFTCASKEASICGKFQSANPTDIRKRISDRIVVLGGTFSGARDRYASTLGVDTPGLILNAMAVRAEIVGPHLRELSTARSWTLDLLAGLLTLFLADRLNRRKAAAIVIVACLFVSLLLLLYVQVVWVSWTVLILAGLLNLDEILERREMLNRDEMV